jgi:RNA polymerase sigma-70 factor (ECF subfamily)
MEIESAAARTSHPDDLYKEAANSYGAALERLARGYEMDPDRRLDLLQEIHLALWQSLARFDGRCSLRTWVYRVAHNVAASHVIRDHRRNSRTLIGLEGLENSSAGGDRERAIARQQTLDRLLRLIQQLKPLDRQVILSYLEEMDAATIAEITGLSPGNVATKIHRIQNILARQFHEGGSHGE